MKNSVVMTILMLCILFARNLLAQDSIAVLALISKPNDIETAKMAAAIHDELKIRAVIVQKEHLISRVGGIGPKQEDLETLRGMFQQGYLQSYNFEYQLSVKILSKVLKGLERIEDTPARWDLFVRSCIFLGKSYDGLKKKEAVIDSFKKILRSRPDMKLKPAEYPPRTRRLWAQAKSELEKEPKGILRVDSEPTNAEVWLDGVKVGKTPFVGSFPIGLFLLRISHDIAGDFSRYINIDANSHSRRYKIQFESALRINLNHPAVLIEKDSNSLLKKWWPWLGARLQAQKLAVIWKKVKNGQTQWVASLVNVNSSRVIRQGLLERSGLEEKHRMIDAFDLAQFLIGKKSARVTPIKSSNASIQSSQSSDIPEAKSPQLSVEGKHDHDIEKPLWRTWWPYAIGAGVTLGGGIAAHVISEKLYSDSRIVNREKADTWLGMAIGGYVLTGAFIAASTVFFLTNNTHPENQRQSILVSTLRHEGIFVGYVGQF